MIRRLLTMIVVSTVMRLSMATEDKPQAAPLRQNGPYGRDENRLDTSNFEINYGNPNRGYSLQDDYDSMEERYPTHNYDGFSQGNDARQGFNSGERIGDSNFRSMVDQYRQRRQGAGRVSRPGPNRRMGGMDYDFDMIDRSGGGGGSGASIDIYSILALGLFAAFLGYIVYYYISVNGGGRALGIDAEMMKLVDEVTNGIERWALFEFLPQQLEGFDINRLLRAYV